MYRRHSLRDSLACSIKAPIPKYTVEQKIIQTSAQGPPIDLVFANLPIPVNKTPGYLLTLSTISSASPFPVATLLTRAPSRLLGDTSPWLHRVRAGQSSNPAWTRPAGKGPHSSYLAARRCCSFPVAYRPPGETSPCSLRVRAMRWRSWRRWLRMLGVGHRLGGISPLLHRAMVMRWVILILGPAHLLDDRGPWIHSLVEQR